MSNFKILSAFLLSIVFHSCNQMRTYERPISFAEDNHVYLVDLMNIINYHDDLSYQTLQSIHYEQIKTKQFLFGCEKYEYLHQSTSNTIDNSHLHLGICEDHLYLEWAIDTHLNAQIPRIVNQAIELGFVKLSSTPKKSGIIDSYYNPDELLLFIYNKGVNEHPNEEIIMISKTL